MSYNGWTNYETWCVALWIGNDEGMYTEAREMARDSDDPGELAARLSTWIDEVAEMTCPGCRESASFVTDLLGTALDAVDYDEIAQNMHSEVSA